MGSQAPSMHNFGVDRHTPLLATNDVTLAENGGHGVEC